MKNTLKYKEFIGSVYFSSEDEIFYGKIEGINDLVTFEGNSVEQLKKSFIEAVNDYIFLCKENNKEIFKSYKGSFNIRISQDLHQKAVYKAMQEGVSLNQFVTNAIVKEVSQEYGEK